MNNSFAKLSIAGLLAAAIHNLPAQVSFQQTPPVLPGGYSALADFNGDGIPDVAVLNQTGVLVYLGIGNGTFQAPIATNSGTSLAGNAVVGDFNGDGIQDLVVVGPGFFVEPAVLLLGNGDGTFQSPRSLGVYAGYVAAGDCNGDKNLDLVLASYSSLVVLLGDGKGDFTQVDTIPAPTVGGIALGSLSSNHRLDILVSNPSTGFVSVYPGNGDGTFGVPITIEVGQSPGPVAIHDMNGDGYRDIVVGDMNSYDVAIILSEGNGNFQNPVASPVPAQSGDLQSLAIGDFNGDGKPDVAILGYVLPGTGTAELGPGTPYQTFGGSVSVITSDLNHDGKLDLVVASSAAVSVLLGNGNGTFHTAPDMRVGTDPVSIAVADFNGDGHADLVVANQTSGSLTIALGTGKGSFVQGTPVSLGFSPEQVIVGNFRGDAYTDIVVACGACGNGTVIASFAVLLGDGTGHFQLPIFGGPPSFGFGVFLAAGDFNNDGKLDLVMSGVGGVSVLLGNGDGTFQNPLPVPNAFGIGFAIGDLNKDGNLDFVVNQGYSVAIYLGKGDGTFTLDQAFPLGNYANSVVVADVNGDGNPDVLLAGGFDVMEFLGDGRGNFQPEHVYPFPLSAGPGMVAADFNRDGHLDLAVISPNSVSILPGNGDGSFQPAQIFGVDLNPLALAVGFLNAGPLPDLVVANTGSNTVSVLINTTP